ncbi:hypothetical protein SORBI_3001G265200 [Sorghum bicolor]|uniref:Uncharacterized protein n=1 Tax=Sorghum bicolor TaxID=4558 RepID=A0A1B6QL83_SORBI|nr:hypothetical protein SORBI_3001G265200 [Sorghum bicolor]
MVCSVSSDFILVGSGSTFKCADPAKSILYLYQWVQIQFHTYSILTAYIKYVLTLQSNILRLTSFFAFIK